MLRYLVGGRSRGEIGYSQIGVVRQCQASVVQRYDAFGLDSGGENVIV